MTGDKIEQLASAFFSAIEAGDLDRVSELYSPDVAVWHNVTGETQTRNENMRLLKFWISQVGDLKYEILSREFFPGGFVQRHVVHGIVSSGEQIEAAICVVVHAANDRIVRLFEYLDRESVKSVFDQPAVR